MSLRYMVLLGGALAASTSFAGVITFDEFPATNNNVALTTAYSALGVTFDDRNSGTWGGIANGDPGSWDLNGTNGPQFLGNNGLNDGDSYAESIFFAVGQTSVSFDASRSNGSSAGQMLTADAYNGSGTLVDSEVLTLGNINTWTTFTLLGSDITRVDLTGSINGFSPYGIDNLQFSSSTVPEPSYMVLLGPILAGLIGVRRAYSISRRLKLR